MQIHTIASGSSGNCLLASQGSSHLLVDAGVSCKKITAALAEIGLTPADLSGILITHEHVDHIRGLPVFMKRTGAVIYTSPGTAQAICSKYPELYDRISAVNPREEFQLRDFGVNSFSISHDAAQPMGFTLECGNKKAAVVTDLGYVSQEVRDGVRQADFLLCETNHDPERLWAGPYPSYLKERIAGDEGHLSNEAGAELVCQCVEQGASTVLLGHLSRENNTPQKALDVTGQALMRMGAVPGADLTLAAAPRDGLSICYEV